MAEYCFLTEWRINAPQQRVWEILNDVERTTEWHPCYKAGRILTPGVVGVGAACENVIRGVLPYDLRYRLDCTAFDPPRESRYRSTGDVVGEGRMVCIPDGEGTLVQFYWTVRTAGFWMNLLAPLLKWLFAWNHNYVMRQGERGLVRWFCDSNKGGIKTDASS
jgi:hypothetical protein